MSQIPRPIPIPSDPSGPHPWVNPVRQMLAALRALANIKGANDITVAVSPAGVIIGRQPSEMTLLARVVAVVISGTRYTTEGQQPPYAAPSTVSYEVAVFGRPDIGELDGQGILRGKVPKYGRPVKDDESAIWPARVGDRCWLHRFPGPDGAPASEIEIMSERIAFKPCAAGSGTP